MLTVGLEMRRRMVQVRAIGVHACSEHGVAPEAGEASGSGGSVGEMLVDGAEDVLLGKELKIFRSHEK